MRRGLRPSDQGAKLSRAVADTQGSVHTAPNQALEPTAYSFGFAPLRLRFRRRLTAGVRCLTKISGQGSNDVH